MLKFASESIRPSTIYIKVSFSKLITVIKHCIVTVYYLSILWGLLTLTYFLCSNDFDKNGHPYSKYYF